MNFKYTFNRRILSEPSLSIPPAKPDLMAELLYKGNPTWELTDWVNTIENVVESSHFISLPVIAFLGTFASGKTFLLDYLLGNTGFVSGIGTTSSVITVIRHLDSKPADWNQEKNVFSLKKGSPLNTNEIIDVSASYYLDEIATLSTYDYKIDHDVLVVFMDRPILNKMTLVDCPGTGTASEAVKKSEVAGMAAKSAAVTRAAETREQELQKLAVECSDGLILLSAVGGSGDLFSDAGFKNILSMAAKTLKIRKKQDTAPLLYIGSLADPQQDGSHDYKALVRKAKESIRNRINELTGVADDVIEKISLADKLVFFYLLSDEKIEDMINTYERALSKSPEAETKNSIRESALSMFNESRADYERKDDVLLELLRLCDDLQIHTYSRGKKYCSNKLQHAVKHYESRTKHLHKYTTGIPKKNALSKHLKNHQPIFIKALSDHSLSAKGQAHQISEFVHKCVSNSLEMYVNSDNFKSTIKSHRHDAFEDMFYGIKNDALKYISNKIYDAIDENVIQVTVNFDNNMNKARLLAWESIEPEYEGDCHLEKYQPSLDEIGIPKASEIITKFNINKRLELLYVEFFDFNKFGKAKAYSIYGIIFRIVVLLGVLWITNSLYIIFIILLGWYWLYGTDVPLANKLVNNALNILKILAKAIFHYRLAVTSDTENTSTERIEASHAKLTAAKMDVGQNIHDSNNTIHRTRKYIRRLISIHLFRKKWRLFYESQKHIISIFTDVLEDDINEKYASLIANVNDESNKNIDNFNIEISRYIAVEATIFDFYSSETIRAEKTLSLLSKPL